VRFEAPDDSSELNPTVCSALSLFGSAGRVLGLSTVNFLTEDPADGQANERTEGFKDLDVLRPIILGRVARPQIQQGRTLRGRT
jgi:hypothetical protein